MPKGGTQGVNMNNFSLTNRFHLIREPPFCLSSKLVSKLKYKYTYLQFRIITISIGFLSLCPRLVSESFTVHCIEVIAVP